MMHANNPIEKNITNLFKNSRLHVNDMREFFAENVCEILDDDTNPTAYHEAALRIFDRWYRDLRKTIWTNAAKYALTKNGWTPEEAEEKAETMYRNAFRNIDRKRRKETHDED